MARSKKYTMLARMELERAGKPDIILDFCTDGKSKRIGKRQREELRRKLNLDEAYQLWLVLPSKANNQ